MDITQKIATSHRLHLAPFLATEQPLRAAIEQWYGPAPRLHPHVALGEEVSALPAVPEKRRASEVFAGAGRGAPLMRGRDGQPEALEEVGVDQPAVIQFITRILTAAIGQGASDIHFEPRRGSLDVRFRQDGVLRHVDSVRREFQAACASRIKIMAEMNIAERRLPQDGRISVILEGRGVDMRVSSLPTQYGESLVLADSGQKRRPSSA